MSETKRKPRRVANEWNSYETDLNSTEKETLKIETEKLETEE
jgi:hypothetical protein